LNRNQHNNDIENIIVRKHGGGEKSMETEGCNHSPIYVTKQI